MAPKNLSIIINGQDTALMTREALEMLALQLKEELDREREERNYFQVERDKVRTFWEISRKELEEIRAKTQNVEYAAEESQEENEKLLETEKQRFKSLTYDQESAFIALKAELQLNLKAAKLKHDEVENELYNDKRVLHQKMRDYNAHMHEELKKLKAEQADELARTKKELEKRADTIEQTNAKKLEETRYELIVKNRTEIACIEERKNKQLDDLSEYHKKAFDDLKLYYNDITLNNLALIKSLKEKIEEMDNARKIADRIAKSAHFEAKGLREPLEEAELINVELKRHMSNYDRDKATLVSTTKRLNAMNKEYEGLKVEYETVNIRLEREIAERNDIKEKFYSAVMDAKAKSLERANAIEAKLKKMKIRTSVPKEDVWLLERQQAIVDDMCFEASRLKKAHDDLLATYENRLAKFGIPLAELGFKPLRQVPLEGAPQITIGMGPANLVAKNVFS